MTVRTFHSYNSAVQKTPCMDLDEEYATARSCGLSESDSEAGCVSAGHSTATHPLKDQVEEIVCKQPKLPRVVRDILSCSSGQVESRAFRGKLKGLLVAFSTEVAAAFLDPLICCHPFVLLWSRSFS
jgi:hypothetical protein